MKTTVNKDGSITTSADDEQEPAQDKAVSGAEAKVVESDEQPTVKTRSRASSK